VRTSELAAWAHLRVNAFVESVRAFAAGVEGGIFPWLHLNYADPNQDVFQSYGADNVRRIG
jgi:hypothetical protein